MRCLPDTVQCLNEVRSKEARPERFLLQASSKDKFESLLQLGKSEFPRRERRREGAVFALAPQSLNGGGEDFAMVQSQSEAGDSTVHRMPAKW